MQSAFLSDAPSGLDRQMGKSPSNSVIRVTVTGTAPAGAAVSDQASFFNVEADAVINTTYALATVTQAATFFTNAQTSTFIAYNPQNVRTMNIVGADSEGTVVSMDVRPVRNTPFGQTQTEQVNATAFQNASDYQVTRVMFPLGIVLDGYTFLRVTNDANATPASYKAAFIFGAANDRRLGVTNEGPALLRSTASANQ